MARAASSRALVQRALGLDHAPWSLTGLSAIIFVHAYTMYVYVFLFVAAGLERYDTTLDEAAAGLGATRGTYAATHHAAAAHAIDRRRDAARVHELIRLVQRAVHLRRWTARARDADPRLEAEWLDGARVRRDNGARPRRRVRRCSRSAGSSGDVVMRSRVREKRRASASVRVRPRAIAPIAALVVVTFLVLPHAMVVLVSFARDGAWTTQILPPEYTFDNFRRLASDPELWRPITNSVGMSAVATARECRRLLHRRVSDRAHASARATAAATARRAAVGDSRDGDRARPRGDVRRQSTAHGPRTARRHVLDSSARLLRAQRPRV